jgi:DNA-binding transcriptional LysR family regulator
MLDFQELEHLPVICLEGETSSRSYIEDFLRQNHVEMKPEFELATSDMIVQFALRNLGVGCVVRDFAREYLETGQLFELLFNKIIPKRHFCVVTDTRTQVSVAAQNLLELVYEGVDEN